MRNKEGPALVSEKKEHLNLGGEEGAREMGESQSVMIGR